MVVPWWGLLHSVVFVDFQWDAKQKDGRTWRGGMEGLEEWRCWRPADWSQRPLDEVSIKLSEYWRWWCTPVTPDLCPCLPTPFISRSLWNPIYPPMKCQVEAALSRSVNSYKAQPMQNSCKNSLSHSRTRSELRSNWKGASPLSLSLKNKSFSKIIVRAVRTTNIKGKLRGGESYNKKKMSGFIELFIYLFIKIVTR